jgi:ribonuclease BN (tRNA processing enzyme)
VRLTVVASAPSYTLRPGHASSCYLLEQAGKAIALDLGQGAFAALSAYRDPASLEAIFVSHLHPDHHIDLVPLRHYLRYAHPGQAPSVMLRAPAELRSRIDALHGERGFLDGLPGDDLEAGIHEVAGFQVEPRPVTHALNSHAFRVTAPPDGSGAGDAVGVVYSGDCGRADDLLPLIRQGDTLLCEASWGATERPPVPSLHLRAADAARIAREAGAARLILTHVLESSDPPAALALAREVFGGPVDLAVPGMTIEVG